jgi:hypothetical protein
MLNALRHSSSYSTSICMLMFVCNRQGKLWLHNMLELADCARKHMQAREGQVCMLWSGLELRIGLGIGMGLGLELGLGLTTLHVLKCQYLCIVRFVESKSHNLPAMGHVSKHKLQVLLRPSVDIRGDHNTSVF